MCYFSRTLLFVPGRSALPSTGRQFTGSERPASKTPICFQKEVFSLQWLGVGAALFRNDQVCSPNDLHEGGSSVWAQESFTTVCVRQNSHGRNAWKWGTVGFHTQITQPSELTQHHQEDSTWQRQLLSHTRTHRHIPCTSSSILRPFCADTAELTTSARWPPGVFFFCLRV